MKILQIITLSELGGAQSVVVNLATMLSVEHKVIVAAGEGDGKLFDLLNRDIVTERVPNLVRRLSPIDDIKALFQLKKLYKKYKPDIIHLHSSKAGILGRLAFPKNKIVYTVHGFDSIRIAHHKFLPLERFLQKKCAAIVGVSKYDEHNLKAEKINNNVSTVYNGIYIPKAIYCNPFAKINRRNGIVLCIARLSPPKNHQLYIEIAEKLPNYTFVWIGNQDTPEFDYPDNLIFMGNISGAASYIPFADLFVLPSDYEGLPMVIIEALSNGIPVVASDVGGISELLDGYNGYALKNDAGVMASYIDKILTAPDKDREKMTIAAKETYYKNFTVDKMAKGYIDIYNNILRNITVRSVNV